MRYGQLEEMEVHQPRARAEQCWTKDQAGILRSGSHAVKGFFIASFRSLRSLYDLRGLAMLARMQASRHSSSHRLFFSCRAALVLQPHALMFLTSLQMNSDGNCFFRAIADQLGKPADEHHKVRGAVVDSIAEHKDEYAAFIEDDEDFDAYISRMRRVRNCRLPCCCRGIFRRLLTLFSGDAGRFMGGPP
jgi:OTU-like cysteine protease